MGAIPYTKMLALGRKSVESESMPGFGTVTFRNDLKINRLLIKPRAGNCLVSLPEDSKFAGRFPALDALPCPAGLLQRDASQCGFRLFLDLLFAAGVAAPIGARESLLDRHLEVLEIFWLKGVRVAEWQRAVEERALDRGKLLLDRFRDAFLRY